MINIATFFEEEGEEEKSESFFFVSVRKAWLQQNKVNRRIPPPKASLAVAFVGS